MFKMYTPVPLCREKYCHSTKDADLMVIFPANALSLLPLIDAEYLVPLIFSCWNRMITGTMQAGGHT